MSLSRYNLSQVVIDNRSCRTLPFGKRFHIFFLHRQTKPESDKIKEIKGKLEAEGYACGTHRDHFIPGLCIFENVNKCIEISVTIGVLLTKNFLKSTWCMKELECAVLCQMRNRFQQPMIIPLVMDLDETEIPELVNNLTYLDISESVIESWFTRLQSAIHSGLLSFKGDTEIALELIQRDLSFIERFSLSNSLDYSNEQQLIARSSELDHVSLKTIFGIDAYIQKHFLKHCTFFIVNLTINYWKYLLSNKTQIHTLISKTIESCFETLPGGCENTVLFDDLFKQNLNIFSLSLVVSDRLLEIIVFINKPELVFGNMYLGPYKALAVSVEKYIIEELKSNVFQLKAGNDQYYCTLLGTGYHPFIKP